MRIDREKLLRVLAARETTLQQALAKAGISPNAYFTLQRKQEILPKSLLRLAQHLGLPASELLKEIPAPLRNAPARILDAARGLDQFARAHHGFLFLFGSRSRNEKGRENADWDFAFLGIRPCPVDAFASAKEKVRDRIWPMELDFVDLNRAPAWFLRSVEDDLVLLSRKMSHEKAA